MMVLHVAGDVLREAIARRYMIALFTTILVGLFLLTFALDLEVVEGALAARRLFGRSLGGVITPVDVALRPIFQALALFIFYFGLLFGIVATADIAPKMLAPGRVELLLSLPVRRTELVLGTYLGVLAIAVLATSFAVGGVSLVLFYKARFVTVVPLVGAGMATLGFMAIYALMLLAACLARSAALSAGAGLLLHLAGLVTSDRQEFLGWFRSGATRAVLEWVIAPLPRLGALAKAGSDAATGQGLEGLALLPLSAGVLVFAAAMVAAACFVVSGKDY